MTREATRADGPGTLACVTGSVAFGVGGAVVGWWQLSLLPDPELGAAQSILVAAVAGLLAVGAVVHLIRSASARLTITGTPLRTVALALSGGTLTVVVLLGVVRLLGSRVENDQWWALLAVFLAAAIWVPLARPAAYLPALAALTVLAWLGTNGRHAGWWMAAGLVVLAGLTALLVRTGVHWSALGAVVALLLVGSVVVGTPVLAGQRDARPLQLSQRLATLGHGDVPEIFDPELLAAGTDGSIAVLDTISNSRDVLWRFGPGGRQDRIPLVPEIPSAPDGTPLPALTSDDGTATAGLDARDPSWVADLRGLVDQPAPDPVTGTLSMAFDAGGNLFGITDSSIWSLPAGSTRLTVLPVSLPADLHLHGVAAGDVDAPLAVQVWNGPLNAGHWEMRAIDPVTGSITDVPLDGPDGQPLADANARQGQDWLLGVSGGQHGVYYTLAGLSVVRFTLDGHATTIATLPPDTPPLTAAHVSGTTVVEVSRDQDKLITQLVDLPSASDPPGVGTVDPALTTGTPTTKDCRLVASGTIQVGPDGYLSQTAVLPDGTVIALAAPGDGCLPTLYRFGADREWVPLLRDRLGRSQEDWGNGFRPGEDVSGPVWSPTTDGGHVAWLAPALNAVVMPGTPNPVVPLPGGWTGLYINPGVRITAIAEGGGQLWLVADAWDGSTGTHRGAVLRNSSMTGDGWVLVSYLDGARDLDVEPDGTVVLARCGEVVELPAGVAASAAGLPLSAWTQVAGLPVPGDDPVCRPVAAAGRYPTAAALDTSVSPTALSVLVPGQGGSPGGGRNTGPLVYTAEVNHIPGGEGLVSRIRVVGRGAGDDRDLIGTLPGGDLSDLGLYPVDLDVDPTGRVCIATTSATGPGPVVLVAGGKRRIVSLPDAQLTGCSWLGTDLVLTDGASGDVVVLSVPQDRLRGTGPFVPGSTK